MKPMPEDPRHIVDVRNPEDQSFFGGQVVCHVSIWIQFGPTSLKMLYGGQRRRAHSRLTGSQNTCHSVFARTPTLGDGQPRMSAPAYGVEPFRTLCKCPESVFPDKQAMSATLSSNQLFTPTPPATSLPYHPIHRQQSASAPHHPRPLTRQPQSGSQNPSPSDAVPR